FYAKPYINMRGVPAMKYQSDNTILVETEWKFKVYKRWSIDTFVGSGKAFESFDSFGAATWVYSYGLGFRYTISRLFGIDAGMDFAWSNNGDFGFSIVFGSAWSK
ncbi:MAG: glyceraldehyde-3-phosphate dehydrogenase, partial [Bacteroidetes bacterium]|nr:glyceraldehyde-3-phosphate dehydrogenase [Bacteroidota bacterium]